MRSRLSSSIEYLGTSLWPVPLAGLLLALFLAITTVYIDVATTHPLLALITNDPDAARAVLGVVATSMLTFTALIFTITMVVLQLAASQYSPRITREFLRDRRTKLTLAIFLGTFAYSLLVLRSVRAVDDGRFVPSLSVGVTYLLVFSSLVAFVGYLSHVSKAIRVSHIVRHLAQEGIDTFERLADADRDTTEEEPDLTDYPISRVIDWTGRAGVLAHVDEQALARHATEHDAVIVLRQTVGNFIPHGAPVMELRGTLDVGDATLCETITVGPDRTPQQDLVLPIRHLVDVALRALSPGINDPTTAVQAIDYVHDYLRRVACATLPKHCVRGPDDRIRLIIPRVSWPTLVALAITEIRIIAADQVQVSRRILHMLDDLLISAPAERRIALEHQRRLWIEATRGHYDLPEDRIIAHHADSQGIGATTP